MTESYDEYFERHNGKIVKIDGLAYKIKYSEFRAKYPHPHISKSIELVPMNRNSEYYRKIKAKLGDDWTTDGHNLSEKSIMQIAKQLGAPK